MVELHLLGSRSMHTRVLTKAGQYWARAETLLRKHPVRLPVNAELGTDCGHRRVHAMGLKHDNRHCLEYDLVRRFDNDRVISSGSMVSLFRKSIGCETAD